MDICNVIWDHDHELLFYMEVVHNEGLMPDAGEILFPNAPFRYSGCKKSFVNPIVVTLGTTVDLCLYKSNIMKNWIYIVQQKYTLHNIYLSSYWLYSKTNSKPKQHNLICIFNYFQLKWTKGVPVPIFQLHLAVNFIGGGNRSTRRKPPTCHKSLTKFIT